jgi:EAL domain-containing protein (putative c-di-GMP-specific phosphodiesterase class I)
VPKLDRSLIHGIGDEPDAVAVVGGLLSMAATLGLEVLAEGVETAAELHALEQIGCARVQGYLCSRPMRGERLARALAGSRPWLGRARRRDEAQAPA